MRLVDDAAQQVVRGLLGRRVGLEVLARADQHLLGGHRTTAVAAHAVGKHCHQHARPLRMTEERDAILLFLAIADMHGDTGFGREGHWMRDEARWTKEIGR